MTRMFTGDELVIATHNKGKMEEFAGLFDEAAGIRFYAASDFGLESPEETGTTFIENATLKALFTARATGKITLADDSGICVSALNGEPGVYTADWAGEPRNFRMAMETVQEKLGDNPDRRAYFVSCLVLAWPDGHTESVQAEAHGTLVWPLRGKEGHGFDPMFQPDGHEQTYAEMPFEQKNAISHRSKSFKMLMQKCFNHT